MTFLSPQSKFGGGLRKALAVGSQLAPGLGSLGKGIANIFDPSGKWGDRVGGIANKVGSVMGGVGQFLNQGSGSDQKMNAQLKPERRIMGIGGSGNAAGMIEVSRKRRGV